MTQPPADKQPRFKVNWLVFWIAAGASSAITLTVEVLLGVWK